MNFDFKQIDPEWDFKRGSQDINTQGWNSMVKNYLKKLSVFFAGVSSASLFCLLNNISFEQQIAFIRQPTFNGSLLLFSGLFVALIIILDTFSTAKNGKLLGKKFSSIWTPFQYAFYTALILPLYPNNSSIFSETLVQIIQFVAKLSS